MRVSLPFKAGLVSTLVLAACASSCNRDEAGSELPQPATVAANRELAAVAKALAHNPG